MNPPRSPHAVSDGAPDARHDMQQRDVVDVALQMMRAAGTLSALEFLKSHAVSSRIITRVLLDPARRRGSIGLNAA